MIATSNEGKRREFETLLGAVLEEDWKVLDHRSYPGALPEIEENKESFSGNAIKKALETSEITGVVVLADDSGLEVDGLGGAPGVRTARFAGENATDEENIAHLLEALKGKEGAERRARFRVALALVMPDTEVARRLLGRAGWSFGEVEVGASRKPEELVRIEDRVVVWFEGTLEGRIAEEPRGEGGFGYDPVFLLPGEERSLAELSREEKNQISHRGQACRKLAAFFGSGE